MQNLNLIEYQILNKKIEFNMKDIISHCLANGWHNNIEEYFNDINDIICKKKKIEDIKYKKLPVLIEYSTKLLNNIVHSDQDTFTKYKININIDSEDKKYAIENASKEIFYNTLKNQYKILEKIYNLHLTTPDLSQLSLSSSLNKSIEKFSSNEIILE